MSSKLTGLFRKLTWADFKGPQPASNPGNMKALTASSFSASGTASAPVGKGTGQTWQLADSFVVEIKFDSSQSWVLPSVASMPQADKDKLLKHEQSHYDLTALLARDMFLEMMQLKGARLSSSSVVLQEAIAIHTRYANIAQPLQKLYDSTAESDHGRSDAQQKKWDGFIEAALTKVRVPQMTTPDGILYKEEILSIVRGSGLTI